VALSASKLGVDNIIVMPKGSPTIKIDAVRKFGGNVLLHGDTYDEAQAEALRLVEASACLPANQPARLSVCFIAAHIFL
jgi:threonine dehydratase